MVHGECTIIIIIVIIIIVIVIIDSACIRQPTSSSIGIESVEGSRTSDGTVNGSGTAIATEIIRRDDVDDRTIECRMVDGIGPTENDTGSGIIGHVWWTTTE